MGTFLNPRGFPPGVLVDEGYGVAGIPKTNGL